MTLLINSPPPVETELTFLRYLQASGLLILIELITYMQLKYINGDY